MSILLDRLDRQARELGYSIKERIGTPMYSLKDGDMRDLLEDAAKRIRVLESREQSAHRPRRLEAVAKQAFP